MVIIMHRASKYAHDGLILNLESNRNRTALGRVLNPESNQLDTHILSMSVSFLVSVNS